MDKKPDFAGYGESKPLAPPAHVEVPIPEPGASRQPEHIMQFFDYAHLPDRLQLVSRPFGEMAKMIELTVPRNPERTVALRKLLEAKDAAVRAMVAK